MSFLKIALKNNLNCQHEGKDTGYINRVYIFKDKQ